MTDKNSFPPGIPNIIGNEAAERFSYYGMKTILVIFMTKFLLDSGGGPAPMSDEDAKFWYHMFNMANYFFPILGALLSDILWGKYRTIISLSIVYCLGHGALALFETRFGLALGLTLIAMGSGGIKPCVSAHVGDQFGADKKHLIERIFSIFYFSINLGAVVSSLLTPLLLHWYGPSVAFGIPGFFMLLATWVFWLGRNKFIAMPPVGWKKYRKDVFSSAGKKALLNLSIVYVFVAIFWSLFDQMGSSWVLQADKMNRHLDLNFGISDFGFLRFELLASQAQALNPLLILVFIPIFTFWIYPTVSKWYYLSPLRRITIGMFICAASFVIVGYAEHKLQAGAHVSIWWQFLAIAVITSSEVLVSITALEFSYTQAPNSMK